MYKNLASATIVLFATLGAAHADTVFRGGFTVTNSSGCTKNYYGLRRSSILHPVIPRVASNTAESLALHNSEEAQLYSIIRGQLKARPPRPPAPKTQGALITDAELNQPFPASVKITTRQYKDPAGTIQTVPNAQTEFIYIAGTITNFADETRCLVSFKANYVKSLP